MSPNVNTVNARYRPALQSDDLSFTTEDLRCVQLNLYLRGERVAYTQLHKSADHCLEVVDLLVEPEHRGKGFGRALLNKVLEFARSNGFGEVCAHASPDNGPAYRLFQRLGFHACQSEVHLERSV